jgi:exosortase family protein XrtF
MEAQKTIDKKLVFIFLKITALYAIWYVVYQLWLVPQGKFDAWMNENVAYGGWVFVRALGYDGCIEGTNICVNIVSTVKVNTGCNGFEIYCIFAGFIIIFASKFWKTLAYIVIGIMIIYVSNIVRVGLLAIDHYKRMHLFNFNHKFTYVVILYGIVFMLWYIWVTRFSLYTNREKN